MIKHDKIWLNHCVKVNRAIEIRLRENSDLSTSKMCNKSVGGKVY